MKHFVKQNGFSLLELITVVVLLGILASGAGLLITRPIEAYNDQLRRQQLVDQAEMALRQLARDVRRALPNSVRVGGGGTALEMVNTVDGARYRDENQSGLGTIDEVLDFTSADTQFNFLGRLNGLSTLFANHRLVIYNTVPTNIYTDAVAGDPFGVITPIGSLTLSSSAIYSDEDHIVMNPAFRFTQQSPGQRAFIVDGPISYICDTATRRLIRYDNYSYQVGQPTVAPAGATSGPVATQLSACNIRYQAGTAQRGGIVTIEITIDDVVSTESLTLLHQVHVVNVP